MSTWRFVNARQIKELIAYQKFSPSNISPVSFRLEYHPQSIPLFLRPHVSMLYLSRAFRKNTNINFKICILSTLSHTHTHTHTHIYIYTHIYIQALRIFQIPSWKKLSHDIDTRLTKAWTAIDRLSIIWKSNLTDKMKCSFFQATVVSILLYGCTTWTLTKRLEKKLDGNYTSRLRAILNKSWQQHPTRHQLYSHQPPITKTIQARQTRHAGHCWRSKDGIVSDVLLWTPAYGQSKAGWPARTYIQQLCDDTGCSPEDLPEAMNDRDVEREGQEYRC